MEEEGGFNMKLCEQFFEQVTDTADTYMKQSDWTDLALIKLCMAAIGVIMGTCISRKKKIPVLVISSMVFVATLIPIMIRFLPILIEDGKDFYEKNIK